MSSNKSFDIYQKAENYRDLVMGRNLRHPVDTPEKEVWLRNAKEEIRLAKEKGHIIHIPDPD